MDNFYLLVALGCLLIVILAINVSRLRYKEHIAHGDRDNKKLRNAIQAHANSIEQIIPFTFIIFALISQNTNPSVIQFLVVSFLILRLIYAVGMTMFIFRAWQITSSLSYLLTLFSCCLILFNMM